MRSTLENAAREAVGSVCEDVHVGSEDDLVDGVVPGLVALPTSTQQVAEVMRAAAAHELTVVPRGRGTKLSWGTPPTVADLVVDLSRMDQVLDHQAGDLILASQAGTRMADVQEAAGQERQRLVLDETVPGASVGGTLATNASGPERLLVGTARDLLIGVTVVRADGAVAKAGGRVVKNVAGYDLGKLMIGSFGTLAVITEAIFRLHPVPEAERWVSVAVHDADEAHTLAHAVLHSQAVPGAIEVDRTSDGPGTLAVKLGGRPEGVEARVEAVRALLGETSEVSDEPPAGWASYPWERGETGLKLTCVLSGLRDVLRVAGEAGARVRGSAGTGVLYAAISEQGDPGVVVEALRAACARHQGTAVVVDGPREVKQSLDMWGPVPALPLMRRVKDQFDPEHRLAPGRFVGGI